MACSQTVGVQSQLKDHASPQCQLGVDSTSYAMSDQWKSVIVHTAQFSPFQFHMYGS